MKPILKLPRAPIAATPAPPREIAGLAERRKQAVRALEQTREAIRSGRIAQSGETAVKELETALVGKPDPGGPDVIRARVVAASIANRKVPAVPLAGLQVRVKIKDEVVREETSNEFGLVDLEIPKEVSRSGYEIEVLAPDCSVLSCQRGRFTEKQPSPVHLFELPRRQDLKPHIERARPIEDGLRRARERAALARTVAVQALDEQEKRLVDFVAEIDEAIKCAPSAKPVPPKQGPKEEGASPGQRPRVTATTAPQNSISEKKKTSKSAAPKGSQPSSKRRPGKRKKSR